MIVDTYPLAVLYHESPGGAEFLLFAPENGFKEGVPPSAKGHRLIAGLLPLDHHYHPTQPLTPLVIMNLQHPILTSFEDLLIVKELPEDTPFLICTSLFCPLKI